ncbi:MAG: hypothetical protein AAGK93_00505 [Pseudomonadota bacterium]
MSLFPHRVPGCQVTTKGKHVLMTFNSLDACLRQAEAAPSRHWQGEAKSRSTDRFEFYGTRTFEEAVSFGRYGWKEGREKLVRATLSLRDLAEGHLSVRSEDRDVYGSRPDVPLFCAGAPEHMVVPGDRFGPAAPLVDLLVQACVSADADADEIINYGAALASLIDATEAERRRVRVTLAFGTVSAPYRHDILVRVKDHSEALDIDRLAFALACPSMLRRITFSLTEQGNSPEWFAVMGFGYGQPSPIPPSGSEINVPSLQDWKGDKDWSTPEAAFETMKSALVKELEGGDDE